MYYYKFCEKYLMSMEKLQLPFAINGICENEIMKADKIFYIFKGALGNSKRCFSVTEPRELFMGNETIDIIKKCNLTYDIPTWIYKTISEHKITALNINYTTYTDILNNSTFKDEYRINVIGLGDVGGTLCIGLKLLGGDTISKIGIYDKDDNKTMRWEFELNQICSSNSSYNFPDVTILKDNELFNCDMFVFCVSVGVPAVGNEKSDVRLSQLQGNSKIMSYYAKLARSQNYKGIFAVVSDPVDLLCKVAFNESNKDDFGITDFRGLAPEQIQGYGLGVMYARASYFAKNSLKYSCFMSEGRVFGPHGKGIIVANSIINYDENDSCFLTENTEKANLQIRKAGYKPFIAPALSSGCLSILSTLRSEWHYSSIFLGGSFFGIRNKLSDMGMEIEKYDMCDELFLKINDSYNYIKNIDVKL